MCCLHKNSVVGRAPCRLDHSMSEGLTDPLNSQIRFHKREEVQAIGLESKFLAKPVENRLVEEAHQIGIFGTCSESVRRIDNNLFNKAAGRRSMGGGYPCHPSTSSNPKPRPTYLGLGVVLKIGVLGKFRVANSRTRNSNLNHFQPSKWNPT